jgi:N-acyl-D-aspartate/D-glutamate deacylase
MNEIKFRRGPHSFRNNHRKNRGPKRIALLIAAVLAAGILLGAGLFWARRKVTDHFDILIVNGMVVDGNGTPARQEIVGIRGGKIVPVKWPYFAEADLKIDAQGLVVAPGFIDVHTHIEGNVRGKAKNSPLIAPNFLAQGTTTIITGNCGTSAPSLSQFFSQLEAGGVAINVGSLIGHNTIRRQVLGEASKAPSGDELRKMCQLVDRAMRDGALGLSSGLEYAPGLFASPKEIEAMAAIAGRYHGTYATHMRDEGNGVIESLNEALNVARNAKTPLQISHLKSRGRENWGTSRRLIEMILQARQAGLQVRCDAYPYTASSTSLDILIPKSAKEGGPGRMRERLRSPDERRRMAAEMCENIRSEGYKDFSFARVAYCQFAPEYEGLTIPEIASLIRKPNPRAVAYQPEKHQTPSFIKTANNPSNESKSNSSQGDRRNSDPAKDQKAGAEGPAKPASEVTGTGEQNNTTLPQESLMNQAETVCYIAAKGGAQMIYENMSEDDVANVLRFPDCMLGSDSGIRMSNEGRPHPRGYGSAPRLLSRFALELKIFSLEEAIRKMTSLPADTFGISNRGKLLPGYWADVVIFSPTGIRDQATYQNPFREPDGIIYVLVNGKVALDHGQTGALNSGQVIRRED